MKRIVVIAAAMLALAVPVADARSTTSPGNLTIFNPCTGEDVDVSAVFHYIVNRVDRSHTQRGTGVGVTSGDEYVFVFRFVETSRDYFEVTRLIGKGDVPDAVWYDDLADGVPAEPICR